MSPRRKFMIVCGAAAFATPLRVSAQRQGKVFRIGVLNAQSRSEPVPSQVAFLENMRELGYVEGKNLLIEERYAEGQQQRLQEHAAELVRLKVDLIVAPATPPGQAAQQATRTIPIVVTATADPVADGFAKSLARPGGNITGMSTGAGMTVTKHIELLQLAIPRLTRVGVLVNPGNRAHAPQLKTLESVASKFGIRITTSSAKTPDEIGAALSALMQERPQAVTFLRETFFNRRGRQIADLALKHRVASIAAFEGYVEAGGLMSYGDDQIERNRRAAILVDKILKGANPAELPFEQPTKFYFAINRKTAHALGLNIPQELLLSADKVIE